MTARTRTKPYTSARIRRVPCVRCGAPSVCQWQICSDGNQYRGFCRSCDVAMNALVLEFVGFPDWKAKLAAYEARETP